MFPFYIKNTGVITGKFMLAFERNEEICSFFTYFILLKLLYSFFLVYDTAPFIIDREMLDDYFAFNLGVTCSSVTRHSF